MGYDANFRKFCKILFSYQYVKQRTELTDAILEWLYAHTSGNISIVVSLIHDAQEIAILNGKEILNLDTLNEAYQQRLSMLHGFIHSSIPRRKQTNTVKKKNLVSPPQADNIDTEKECPKISELLKTAKSKNVDIVQLLKLYVPVTEVKI